MKIVTFKQFQDRFQNLSPKFLGEEPFRISTSKVVCICPSPCGRRFTASAFCVWNLKTKSCSCLRRRTTGLLNKTEYKISDLRRVCSELGIQLISECCDSDLVKTRTNGFYKFRCVDSCLKEFGQTTNAYRILTKETVSCGCAKAAAAKINGINKRGRFTDAQREGVRNRPKFSEKQKAANVPKYSILKSDVVQALEETGSTLTVDIPDKVPTRYTINAFCGICKKNTFQARAADVVRRMSRSCGCLRSQAEQEVFFFIKSLANDAIQGSFSIIPPKQVDVWVPSKSWGLEYNGLYYHSNLFHPEGYHLQKLEDMEARNGRLITLFENEWVERPEVVKTYIKRILGVASEKLYARKLEFRKIESKTARDFTETHHIQGAAPGGAWNGGLFDGDRLVSVLTIALTNQRHAKSSFREWNLIRYCVADRMVVGGFQKLWQAFLREVYPKRVVTFSNRRWSVGGLYERAGFVKDSVTPPSYWYFKEGDKHLYSKAGFQKKAIAKKLGPLLEGETEFKAMERFGYLRIYDCGLVKWVWTPKSLTPSPVPVTLVPCSTSS